MYRHTVSLLNSSLTPAGWEPPALPVHMKTRDVFIFNFFAIWQWVGFVLTLHLSQSPESTRHISKVSKNMQHLLLRNRCCPWVFDIINQVFRSKTGTMKYLALGKRHCLFLWYLAVLRQHCRSQRRQSYIRKCEIMGLISFPDIYFDFEDLYDNTQ